LVLGRRGFLRGPTEHFHLSDNGLLLTGVVKEYPISAGYLAKVSQGKSIANTVPGGSPLSFELGVTVMTGLFLEQPKGHSPSSPSHPGSGGEPTRSGTGINVKYRTPRNPLLLNFLLH
jgi:hypothetical protein